MWRHKRRKLLSSLKLPRKKKVLRKLIKQQQMRLKEIVKLKKLRQCHCIIELLMQSIDLTEMILFNSHPSIIVLKKPKLLLKPCVYCLESHLNVKEQAEKLGITGGLLPSR